MSEVSELGFSGSDVVQASQGGFAGPIRWADDTEASIDIVIVHDGAPATHTQLEATGDPYNDVGCAQGVLRVGVELAVTSTDGRLAEWWATELRASDDHEAQATVGLSDLRGSLENRHPVVFAHPGFAVSWQPRS